jgi:hypothetical protein
MGEDSSRLAAGVFNPGLPGCCFPQVGTEKKTPFPLTGAKK